MHTAEVNFVVCYEYTSRFRILKPEVSRSEGQKTAEDGERGESHGGNVRDFREDGTGMGSSLMQILDG